MQTVTASRPHRPCRCSRRQTITLNRVEKLNAFSDDMYETLAEILERAASDDGVKVAVLTANGSYHSSGNDMANFGRSPTPQLADAFAGRMHRMILSLIDFNKPLVAQIRGPAIGVSGKRRLLFYSAERLHRRMHLHSAMWRALFYNAVSPYLLCAMQ